MLKKALHSLVKILRLEGVLGVVGQRLPLFKRMIPLHSTYEQKTMRLVKRNGAKFLLDISDYMQWYLYIREPDKSWQIARDFVRPGSTVMDIGANIGQFSIPLSNALTKSKIDCRVVAFEPNPEIFNSLKKNIELNPALGSVLAAYCYALGNYTGEIPFIYGMRNSGAGRFTKEAKSTVKVPITTVETFLTQSQANTIVSFIKIDVEGFEPEVIKGAEKIIKNHKPVLFFEFSPTWYTGRGIDAFRTLLDLRNWGYTMFYEKGESLLDVGEGFEPLQNIYQTNILAIPETGNLERHG